jgi:glyoxylate/hydroxypyruvate reductase A
LKTTPHQNIEEEMQKVTALVTRLSRDDEAAWVGRLAAVMPDERVVGFQTLDLTERADVDIAIVINPDPADLVQLPALKWIHSLWAGVERLVSELGDTAKPIVRLVDPQLSRTMAEAVLAWTYYLFRDMPAYAAQQREQHWNQLPYRRADQTTVGILGLGTLGTAAAARLHDAGFGVVGWSRSPKQLADIESYSGPEGLDSVFSKADILVCLLPLTGNTTGMIDAAFLSRLKPGVSLINFARGKVIVAADLLAALDQGHVKHAVLDVFEVEPLPAEDPMWRHSAVTILPHISAPTDVDTAAAIVAANITRYRLTGQLPPTVDMAQGY